MTFNPETLILIAKKRGRNSNKAIKEAKKKNKLAFKNLAVFSVNIRCGPAEERLLLTGLHAVADIYCECCKTTLGWKYVTVFY